jgi:hypothetical protein
MEKLRVKRELEIEVKEVKFPRELTSEEQIDFNEWLKCRAVEFGTGKQCEYYNLEKEDIDIQVIFFVKSV